MIKHMLNRSLNTDLATQLEFESAYQGLAATTDDFKEGVYSFWKNATQLYRKIGIRVAEREGGTVTINEHERVYETLESKKRRKA